MVHDVDFMLVVVEAQNRTLNLMRSVDLLDHHPRVKTNGGLVNN